MSSEGPQSPGRPDDPQLWSRVESVLDELFELDRPPTSADLDRLCGSNVALRQRVEGLVAQDLRRSGPLDENVDAYVESLVPEEPLEDAGEDLSARRFGPYTILRRIGSGGMGVVYEARDERLGRSVAVKLLPREWSRDPMLKERFLREARAASSLDHGNICTIHDVGESPDGRLYLVMAFYAGETLKVRLERGPLPVDTARDIARRLALGLHHAHQAGIVHRDIKPANVMLTDSGEVKILDFGIATMAGEAALTRSGLSPGTPAYMSPEQIRGEAVDGRSDLWSLGVVFFEMLSGRRPFIGDHPSALPYQILEQPMPDLTPTIPPSESELMDVVQRALAKDVERRYDTGAAMAEDLERTITGLPVTVPREGGATRWRRHLAGWSAVGWGAAALVVCAAIVWALGGWPRAVEEPSSGRVQTGDAAQRSSLTATPETSTRLAILPFDNLSRDVELDWMRQGMTQMLITNLAQSPEVDILSGRRLRQALDEVGADAAAAPVTLSAPQLQALGQATEVAAVVQGSFVLLGETLQVTFTLEDVQGGEILRGESFEGQGREALFELVDRMTDSIRRQYELVASASTGRDVQQVTTQSVDAWRYYSEAVQLSSIGKRDEAVVLFKQAVELDPEFALALANLGAMLNAMGQGAEGQRYSARAVSLAQRLPLHERFLVQALHYSTRWSTYDQAIAAYRQGLETFPQRRAWRANLARLYAYVERYEEAVESFEQAINDGSGHTGNFTEAANALAALNRFEDGQELLERYARRFPDRWLIHLGLGWHATEWGRYRDAHKAFDRAAELRPREFFVAYGRWRLAVLEEAWETAEARADEMAQYDALLAQWLAAVARSRNALHQGLDGALDALRDAADRPQVDSFSAQAHVWRGTLLLQRGQAEAALEAAERAQLEGAGDWPELEGLRVAVQAAQRLGDVRGADRRLAELQRRHDAHPNRVERRQLHYLAGWLALERRELDTARYELERAEALLPPRGVEFVWFVYPEHLPIWHALGRWGEAAGDLDAARSWYQRCASSGSERLERPVVFRRCRDREATLAAHL